MEVVITLAVLSVLGMITFNIYKLNMIAGIEDPKNNIIFQYELTRLIMLNLAYLVVFIICIMLSLACFNQSL